ncbi:MAG: DUF6491 family protein [Steroidobacteraceae bacterium]
MKTLLALALVAAVACGCASGLSRSSGDRVLERYEPYVGEPIRGFTAFRTQSWQAVSRNQLILWTSLNDAYLLTITSNCPDLMFTDTVRVTSSGSQISTLDQVRVRDDRCPIQKIQPIDIRQWRKDRDAT